MSQIIVKFKQSILLAVSSLVDILDKEGMTIHSNLCDTELVFVFIVLW